MNIKQRLLLTGFLIIIVGLGTWQWSSSTPNEEPNLNIEQAEPVEVEEEENLPLPAPTNANKITGLSFVGSPRQVHEESFQPVITSNAQWISLMPYSFSRAGSNELRFDSPRQWWGERTEGVKQYIEIGRKKGLKIMLKPHLWIIRGGFTGTFGFEKAEDWANWEQDYEKYILHYARLADSLQIDMYCIGTELERFVKERPQFWKSLIIKVKNIYKGPLTYAENWDAYKRFPFWAELDYIGIDAYFPLSSERTPSVKSLLKGWEPTFKDLAAFHQKTQKPILFTEYGYQSVDYTAKEPWQVNRTGSVNEKAQSQALEALYRKFFGEEWFAGGFLWKWFDNHDAISDRRQRGFTPQGKDAEEVVKKWYKIYQ